jgi:hypothetical protein
LEALSSDELFYRPPIGYLTVQDRTPEKMFQRYLPNNKSSPYKDILIAAIRPINGDRAKRFRENVLKSLRIKSEPKSKPGVGAESGHPIDFEYYDERPAGPITFFRTDEGIHAVIAYRLSAEATDAAIGQMDDKIDYSLSTLALGFAAKNARRQAQR